MQIFCTVNKFKSLNCVLEPAQLCLKSQVGSMLLTGKTDILSAIIFCEGDEGIVLELMILLDLSMHLFSVTFKTCVPSK